MQNDHEPIDRASLPPPMRSAASSLTKLLHLLEDSQWSPPEKLLQTQMEKLTELADYANRYSPNFQMRLKQAKLRPADLASMDGLRRLAPLTRRQIQLAGESLYCTKPPKSHLPLKETRTSGSTGEPVIIRRTAMAQMWWMAHTMREHFWHKRDFTDRELIIRADIAQPWQGSDWGSPVNLLFASGSLRAISSDTAINEQIEHILAFKPAVILTYPSNLSGIIDLCERKGIRLDGVKHLWTISEVVKPQLRQKAERFFGLKIEANYSSNEVGNIALQCPVSGMYHVQSENILLEVVDEKGEPCKPGQTGRVLLTDLHNFATPLIRYEIGDYAEVGGACPCGRGLPVLKDICGRTRNLIAMPDGTRNWPELIRVNLPTLAPIAQFQFVQHDLHTIELKLVTHRPLTVDEETLIRQRIQDGLGYPFTVSFTYFGDRIPASSGGKFEDFICKVEF